MDALTGLYDYAGHLCVKVEVIRLNIDTQQGKSVAIFEVRLEY